MTPKRLQLLFRGSGDMGRQVHSPNGITSQGTRTGQGTAGLGSGWIGSSFVEREVGLVVSQESSTSHCCVTAEVNCTLSCVSKDAGSTSREWESPLFGPSEIVLETLGPVWGFLGCNQP